MAAAATGKGFDALVQEKVFGPSGMRRTRWRNPANIQPGSGLLSTVVPMRIPIQSHPNPYPNPYPNAAPSRFSMHYTGPRWSDSRPS